MRGSPEPRGSRDGPIRARGASERPFATAAHFYAWLEQIVLNALRNQQCDLRRARRDVRREVHADGDARASHPDLPQRLTGSMTTPSRQTRQNEAAAALLSSLARLMDDQRAVVRLRFLEGESVAAVAAELAKMEDAIHALCYQGLKELRAALGPLSQYLSHLWGRMDTRTEGSSHAIRTQSKSVRGALLNARCA